MKLYSERAGVLKKSKTGYEYFLPKNLNEIDIKYDTELTNLLLHANLVLGKLDGIAITVPDIDLFVSMYVQKEAVISSQIEGTQASLVDVLQINKTDNIRDTDEIVNYIKATNYAFKLMNELPLCMRFIRQVHEVLLSDVRGSEKLPGEFRRSQNWIGHKGSTLSSASFIPPAPEEMHICLDELEKYIHEDSEINELIKIGLIHYCFETIHPFLDGNGRMGRLLINLYLKEKNIITHPILYLSYYFKLNRSEYYELLNNVRFRGDFEAWLKFFIRGIIDISNNAITSIQKIVAVMKADTEKIKSLNTKNVSSLLDIYDLLLKHPYITIDYIKSKLNISTPTASKLLKTLLELGILSTDNTKQRYRVYWYREYVDILSEGTEV